MNTKLPNTLDQSIENVVKKIAPTWPLDKFIAVNPMWGHVDRSMQDVAAWASTVKGQCLIPENAYFQHAWDSGVVKASHLCAALEDMNDLRSVDDMLVVLKGVRRAQAIPLLCDIVDGHRDLSRVPSYRTVMTHQVSQVCAAFFDSEQAQWSMRDKGSLYSAWRRAIVADRGLGLLLGDRSIRAKAMRLPLLAEEVFEMAISQLGIDSDWQEPYFDAVLSPLHGWASWCAYQQWQANFENRTNGDTKELLAIVLAWECLLDNGVRDPSSDVAALHTKWRVWRSQISNAASLQSAALVWLRACELAYQRHIVSAIRIQDELQQPSAPQFKAVFCIDVRSEVFRRALEKASPSIETSGFAGFFGLPIAYTPSGTSARRPQLPGLLPPSIEASDEFEGPLMIDAVNRARQMNLSQFARRQRLTHLPGAAFSYVETAGIAYAAGLARNSLLGSKGGMTMPSVDYAGLEANAISQCRPVLLGMTDQDKADMATKILGALSIAAPFPRLVLLAGHGSQTANNPHAAGLDCGACCGQTGEVNARVLAGVLNDSQVRELLLAQGVDLGSCWFVAGLHNTTTDLMLLFDTNSVPDSHLDDLRMLQIHLDKAGDLARAERAPALGLHSLVHDNAALQLELSQRSRDWSQTRPEWGLANNAAFVIGPRQMTRAIDLQGRSFLHDYTWESDKDSSVLELLMTAPMLVTHWINFQYFASRVDPDRLGSGNKVLHNVVGGSIGVFEGNGGDLRIGLPTQSVHDGKRWMHEPLRLSVFIAAPKEKIQSIIDKHAIVHQLVANQWIYLFQVDTLSGQTTIFRDEQWIAF